MTRLVVHAGTHGTDWALAQQQLVSWRDPLAAAGVHLLPSDDAGEWHAAATDVAVSGTSEPVASAARAAVEADAALLLVSSERLDDSLRDPAQVANLESFARDLAMPLTVVVVVRDQVGYLNDVYCDRITRLAMARDFTSFVTDPQPEERFDYETAFDAVLESSGIDVVAVRYSALVDGEQGKAVLAAAGVDQTVFEPLPRGGGSPLPGPYAVAATRLLFKRMWRMGMFTNLPRAQLMEAAAELRSHAVESDWDEQPFWGWSDRARKRAIERFRPGNDIFARTAWGERWGDDWERGQFVDVDLAASPPPLVVDIISSVDGIVKRLQQDKLALTADDSDQD